MSQAHSTLSSADSNSLDEWGPLPPRVHRKNGAWFLVKNNRWHHLGREASVAKRKFRELAADLGIPHVDHSFMTRLYEVTRRRALRQGREFKLTREDVAAMWERSGGRCELTGIRFDEANAGRFARRPWIPSLDRIDSAKGYTLDNTRLICCAMNFALNAWGEEMFERVAKEFLARRV